MNHLFSYGLLFLVAFLAGAINSVAGGGTLLTFPTLLAVLGPHQSIAANATSTVALVPGSMSAFWGYRDDIRHEGRRRDLLYLGLPSLVGGVGGAYLLLHTSDAAFSRLIPWLILGATTLFMIQGPVLRRLKRDQHSSVERPAVRRGLPSVVILFQLGIAIYGGFFGAGIGILMLTALGFFGLTNIHRMNALKNFAAVCINAVASLTFIIGRRVDWPIALMMMVGAIFGGYGGAGLARRMGQANVRRVVVGIGLLIGIVMLYRQASHL